MPLSIVLLIGLCVLLETVEQCLFRLAGRRAHQYYFFIIPGVLLNIIGLLLWLFVLKSTQLGTALPLMAANNVTVAIAGKFLFGERVNLRRSIGIALIAVGFVFVAGQSQ